MAISKALEASPFGQIPAELRLRIWEFALQRGDVTSDADDPVKEDDSKGTTLSPTPHLEGLELSVYDLNDIVNAEKDFPVLSLTQTCQQIRCEAMPVFLETNALRAVCPIFDHSGGHGEISLAATQYHQQGLQDWLQALDNAGEFWSSRIKDLTIDLGIWRICGCKFASRSFVDALSGFSAEFPPQRGRTLKVQFQVQWRAVCICCESDTDDESVWPLAFELERGNNEKFSEAVMRVCEGRAKWILGREGLCGRTKMAWLVQLERASGRLVDVYEWLGRSGKEWEAIQGANLGAEDV